MSESQTPRCEHCGSDRIINRPPGCPMCGAPNCCTVCCNTSRLEAELRATRARLSELEGIAERLASDLRAVQEEQRGDVFAASIREFKAYKEGKK